jgi:hypothetical protein
MTVVSDGLLWVPEARLVAIVGLARSTYQSWAHEGLVERAPTGACHEDDVVEALLVGDLRDHLPVPATRNTMARLRSSGELERLTDRARGIRTGDLCDLVIDAELGAATVCHDHEELIAAVRDPGRSRTVVMVPLTDRLVRVIAAFRNHASRGTPPAERSRGRPRTAQRAPNTVTRLRGA